MLRRIITGAIITLIMGAVLYFSYIPGIMTGTCIVLSAFSVYKICRTSGRVNNKAYLTASLLLAVGLSSWVMPSYLRVLKVIYIVALIGFVILMLFAVKSVEYKGTILRIDLGADVLWQSRC